MRRPTFSTCSAIATKVWATAEAAIEAYRQAAEAFLAEGAQCSYALCLFKIADSYLSLGEPWHAIGYLEACLPLLRDLGMTRHERLARQHWTPARPSWPSPFTWGGVGRPAALNRPRPPRPQDPKDPASSNTVALLARPG